MKKRFTILAAAFALLAFLAIPMGMRGQTSVTWPGTTALPGTATAVANDQNVTIMVSSTNTYTNPIRIYANTTVTINALNGAKILSVAYEASSTGNYVTNAQNATVTPNVTPTVSGKIVTWTYAESANVTEFTFTPSAQTRSNGITITYITPSTGPTVATPTFSPVGGTYTEAQSVEISCSTEGATIYYTLNGEDPTTNSTEYSTAINIEETTTVKAFAVKENYNNSAIASATYTITDPVQEQIFTRIDGHAVEAGQTYLIVDIASGRALTSANGSGSSPAAVEVTIENNQISTNNTDLQWTFEATEGGFIIYPLNSTTTWLYSTASNSGVRVGTNNNKVWTLNITDSGKPSYHGFKHNGTERYLGVYNNQDWRAYGSITTNIENTQIELFVLGDIPYVTPPSISADNVEIEYDDEAGSIAYTINNPVDGGVLTAEVIGTSTIEDFQLGSVGGASVPFTCSPNDGNTIRTASVTLTYTYNTNQIVTKDVTVTQAAAPVIYTTIPEIFAAATSTSTPVTITFGNWVVSAVKNGNAYLTDNQGNGLIIYQSNHGFQVNDVLSGTANCNLVTYQGSAELTGLTSTTEGLTVTHNGTVTPMTIAINTLTGVNTGALLTYENLTYHNGTNNYLTDGAGNQISPYTMLFNYENTFVDEHIYNVTGIYKQYTTGTQDKKQILPRSADDIEEVVSTDPVITVTPATAEAFTYVVENGPSANQLFVPTGENLTSDITVTVNENGAFEITSDLDSDYGYTVTIGASDNGVVVRLKAGLEVGSYTDNLTFSAEGAEDVVIALTGSVTVPEALHYTWDLTTNSYASASADTVVWSSDYAMMIIEKHQSSTNANNYLGGGSNNQTRFYQGQKLSITPNSGYAVDSIVINATASYAEGFTGNDWTNATASTDGTVITVVPTDGDEPFSVVISKACRATGVTVYYRTSTTNVYYNITLSYGEHGIITSDKTTAREGDIVIIAVIPDEYYYASAFGFVFSVGSSLDYEVIEPNVYRVIMPACDLSVSATFDTYYDLHTITIDEGIENGTVVADKVEAPENTLITLTVTPAAGYILEDNNLIVVANTANVEVTKVNATTYTFEMPAENVTVTAEFTAIPATTYTRATYIQSGRHYIIVGFDGEDAYAMGQQNNYNRAAVAISVDGNVATVNSTDGVYEFVINDVAGVKKTPFANSTENVYVQYTIYDPASSGYLYAAGSSSNNLKTETHLDANDNALWYVSQDYNTGIATVVAYGTNTKNRMRYNSTNDVFSCYGANNTQQDVYLYVKNEDTPTFDFYKDVKGYGTSDGGYCFIATPTNDMVNPSEAGLITDDGTNPEDFSYDLYGFDFTQDQEWRNYRSAAFNMNNGQGYLYANKSNVTLHFQGAPYTNQVGGAWIGSLSKEIPLQYDENNNYTFNGFNLVGNPLSIFAGVDRDFYVMNVDGTEVELAERDYVNPMEGVFVKATEANQTVLFEEWIQPDEWGFDDLGVRVSGDNGSSDFARIRFGEGRNLEKFMLNQNHTKLYFTQGNRDFAVVRSANEGEMPVNFKAETNGTYTISVNAENVNMSYLHLIDNVTGADVDLLSTPSYSFEANTNDYATRFRLVFKANANVSENVDAVTFAFFNGSTWTISNVGEATLQVVDVMGRVLSSETVNGNAEFSLNQVPGVYMLRLVNGENVKVQKVVVR